MSILAWLVLHLIAGFIGRGRGSCALPRARRSTDALTGMVGGVLLAAFWTLAASNAPTDPPMLRQPMT